MATFDSSRQWVSLKMQDVLAIDLVGKDYVLNTGSPHYVKFITSDYSKIVKKEGSKIRYNDLFKEQGINVNFVHFINNKLSVLTYERGVEDETYSCGTGVVASAIAYAEHEILTDGIHLIEIETKGGSLEVSFEKKQGNYHNIFLKGPAVKVFEGIYHVK
jgi:diaminopimelate epimerase